MREADTINNVVVEQPLAPGRSAGLSWLAAARSGLAPHRRLLVLILLANVLVLAIDRSYATWTTANNYSEYGPITTLKVLETFLTGALCVAIFLGLGPAYGFGRLFWLVAGVGLFWLAVDDYLQIHERVSWELGEYQAPLVNHWDDLIVLAYAIAGLAALLFFRGEVLASPAVALLLGLGALATALMIGFDATVMHESSLASLEDLANVVASALLLSAFAVKWREV